jgi:hypothetical protein
VDLGQHTPRLVGARELAWVGGQLGRRPHTLSRIAARCPWGYPAAVEDLPYDDRGRPFPTLFYATCPTLVAAVGALESGGGVRHMTALLDEPAIAAGLRAAIAYEHRRRATLARRFDLPMLDAGAALRTGIGGVAEHRRVKCLHAHAAHALARPGYVFGQKVLGAAGELWCADRRCMARTSSGISKVLRARMHKFAE